MVKEEAVLFSSIVIASIRVVAPGTEGDMEQQHLKACEAVAILLPAIEVRSETQSLRYLPDLRPGIVCRFALTNINSPSILGVLKRPAHQCHSNDHDHEICAVACSSHR